MSAVLFKKTSTRQSKYLCVPGSKTAQTTYRPRSCFASSLPVPSHHVTVCLCPRCSCALLSRVWIVRQRLNRLSPFSHCTLHAVQRQTLISISLFSLYLSLSTFHMCEPIRWILAATGTQFENTFCTTPEQVAVQSSHIRISTRVTRAQFQSEKESVPYPFGQLPLL